MTLRDELALRSKEHRRAQKWLFVVFFFVALAGACWLLI
jgi:hypothetical protein